MINELCEIKSCNGAPYLEARKHRDLYLWLARAPHAREPSSSHNVHTMESLPRATARAHAPAAAFDGLRSAGPAAAAERPRRTAPLRALLTATFGTPRPPAQAVLRPRPAFSRADGRVWVRHYQIAETDDGRAPPTSRPRPPPATSSSRSARLVLQPIRVFAGAFGGATLYANSAFVRPRAARGREAGGPPARRPQEREGGARAVAASAPRDVADVFRGALR